MLVAPYFSRSPLTTHHSLLISHNSQLTTHNSQLTLPRSLALSPLRSFAQVASFASHTPRPYTSPSHIHLSNSFIKLHSEVKNYIFVEFYYFGTLMIWLLNAALVAFVAFS